MNRISRNLILLFLLSLSCACYAGRPCKTRTAYRINNVGIELPSDVVAKMYNFYDEPYYARVLIDSVYTFGGASKMVSILLEYAINLIIQKNALSF